MDGLARHWDDRYARRGAEGVSWFEPRPEASLALIELAGLRPGAAVVDIGGGASRLVDALLDLAYDVTVLDVSATALALARSRLGPRADDVRWVVEDVRRWRPQRRFDLWHDRAVLHFLTRADDVAAYVATAALAVRPGGLLVVGTFAPDGPPTCSGLEVRRYDAAALEAAFAEHFTPVAARRAVHVTPDGTRQPFAWVALRASAEPNRAATPGPG